MVQTQFNGTRTVNRTKQKKIHHQVALRILIGKYCCEKCLDGCNEGLKVSNNLRFGAPSGCVSLAFLYRTLNHVLNGTIILIQMIQIIIRLQQIVYQFTKHEITITDQHFATESIVSGKKYALIQRVNQRILLFNDKGDPKVGWSKQECTATTGCAAFILRGIELHSNAFKNSFSN